VVSSWRRDPQEDAGGLCRRRQRSALWHGGALHQAEKEKEKAKAWWQKEEGEKAEGAAATPGGRAVLNA
jgi:hypothetical protein